MPGQTLFIIRHAEKPVPGSSDPGLAADGTPDPKSLVIRGWQRAGAWAALFGSGLDDDFPTPDAVYAADPTRSPDGETPSKRPWQTISPLAARLGIEPITKWAQGEERHLVDEVSAAEGVALICWEHRLIMTGILAALPIEQGSALPDRWKGRRFDVVFRLDRKNRDETFSFQQLLPRLLDRDKGHPMP